MALMGDFWKDLDPEIAKSMADSMFAPVSLRHGKSYVTLPSGSGKSYVTLPSGSTLTGKKADATIYDDWVGVKPDFDKEYIGTFIGEDEAKAEIAKTNLATENRELRAKIQELTNRITELEARPPIIYEPSF